MGNARSTMLPPEIESLLNLSDVGRELRIHRQSVRRLIREGRLEGLLFAGKYFIRRETLEEFKANGYDPRPGRKPGRRML